MPELAEVETVRRQFQENLRGKKIKVVDYDPQDRWLFAFAKPAEVKKALLGRKITGTGRKGKYFWLELDRKPWPIFHLGMSGNVSFLKPKSKGHVKAWGGAVLWSEGESTPQERLWFARLRLHFEKGYEAALTDPRRFGRLWLTDDPWEHPRIKALGYDPLIDFPSVKTLAEKLKKRGKPIKTVLLDQSLFAGIGNWLADEILFQARLSPHRKASSLTTKDVRVLRAKTLAVVKHAVKVGADYEKFPKTWLFHNRWGQSKTAMTSRKQKILHEEIGGRTAAWVPGWQK